MHKNLLLLASLLTSSALASPQSTTTNLPLGAQCDPSIASACANGVSCYATNSGLIPVCGNFQATCTSDSQCAFNTCNFGFCNGLKPSSTSTPSLPKPTGTNLPLGAQCDPAVVGQCANGVNCYATNSMLIPVCGNFQATCTSDSQCAFNTCNNGFCNGFKPTTSSSSSSTSSTSSSSNPTGTNLPLGAQCDPSLPNTCANGVNCYATNSMLIPRCGNFQASCISDKQCAFNTCNSGFCNGLLPSSSSTIITASNPITYITPTITASNPITYITPTLSSSTSKSTSTGAAGNGTVPPNSYTTLTTRPPLPSTTGSSNFSTTARPSPSQTLIETNGATSEQASGNLMMTLVAGALFMATFLA